MELKPGQDLYVCGFFMDYEMDRFILIDKLGKKCNDVSMFWQGIGGMMLKTEKRWGPYNFHRFTQREEEIIITSETPHECMFREFREETGYLVAMKRWHCFAIKEYDSRKIYFFAAFGSPKELFDCVFNASKISKENREGNILSHSLIDVLFDGKNYTFDIPYLISIIIREMRAGMFLKLDPEGVNSNGRIT